MEYADLLLMADFDSKSEKYHQSLVRFTSDGGIAHRRASEGGVSSFNSHWGIGWTVHKSE